MAHTHIRWCNLNINAFIKMSCLFVAVIWFLAAVAAVAELFKWTDDKGSDA